MLAGARVLIVEDDSPTALDLAEEVEAAGGCVVGPYASVEQALRALRTENVDGAILDANLADRNVAPVALLLLKRNVPVIIHTGGDLPAELEGLRARLPVIMKPATARAAAELASRLPEPH